MLHNQNTQDFYNLVHVYLDAVLFPRAVADPFVHAQACLPYPWAAVPCWPQCPVGRSIPSLRARLSVRSPFMVPAAPVLCVFVFCVFAVCGAPATRARAGCIARLCSVSDGFGMRAAVRIVARCTDG
jgi:hypothetical protein